MKKVNENHLDWSNEKKDRRVKKHSSEEACKCFAPFFKLHWHDCPIVNKPCPVHGNRLSCNMKDEKEESEQNITLSFYPSLKTERLFLPVKSLLAQCNPETKINLQYYSPREFSSRGSIKHQLIQTTSEDLKKVIDNNVSVEKSKSFTTDKTNKMKKLKQCFHSPCSSIAKKSRSQVSFKEKMNEIFSGESRHRNDFFNMNLEEPQNDLKYDPSFEWFSASKTGLENLERLTDDRRDSDFITFTQRAKNNVINHKIFEIKHKKGLNDISKVKISKQPTQFVYTSFTSGQKVVKEQSESYQKKRNSKVPDDIPPEESLRVKKKHETSSVSGNSQSSSSGSVYVTPFLLMPTGVDDSDSDRPKTSKMNELIQVEGPTSDKELTTVKETQTTSFATEQKEPRVKSVSLQTDPSMEEKHSQCTREIFLHDYEPSMETVDEKFEGRIKALEENFSDESCWRKKCYEILREKKGSNKCTRSIDVQTSTNYRYKEVFVSTRCDRSIRDQTSQTETHMSETRYREFESKSNRVQITHPESLNKGIQTSFSDNAAGSDTSKCTDLDSSETIRVTDESEPPSSKSGKYSWRKSFSDSELLDKKKCACSRLENQVPLSHNSCCKCSNQTSQMSGTKDYGLPSTATRIFKTNSRAYESGNLSDVTPPPQKQVTLESKAEQTSLVEEDCTDLSELKKIIQDFFEKRQPSSGKKLDGDTPRENKDKIEQSTMTESRLMVHRPPQNMKNAVDGEAQTSIHVLLDYTIDEYHTKPSGQRVKFRQSVLLDDENQTKTFFICAVCGREISKFSVDASTVTENLSSHQTGHPRGKEKTTIVDTEINEVITVKTIKKCPNGESSTGSPKSGSKQIGNSQTEGTTKSLKSPQNSPRGVNFQRSCIPILISGPGSAHLRYDETITFSENQNPQNLEKECEEYLNQKSTSTQVKPRNQRSSIGPQTNTQCICNEIPGTSESRTSRTSPPGSARALKTKEPKSRPSMDIYPSLPRVEHPGVQNSQWRNNERSQTERGRKTDKYFYPVIINSFWPREFMKTWESMENYDDRLSISSNQKRSYEKEVEKTDTPAEKKIKPFFDEAPKESFKFGNSSSSDLFRKEKPVTSLEKNTGFIWVPSSSVPQMSPHSSILNQFKATKSEELLKIPPPQQQGNQVLTEKFRSDDQSEIFTVKSCHLKPITFKNDEQSYSRLLECSFCKSFTLLKAEKKNFAWSNCNTYQTRTQSEDVVEEPTNDGPLQYEEFFRECSHCSDDNDVPDSLENNFSEVDITEVLEESYSQESNTQKPKLQSQSQTVHTFSSSLDSDTATTSKSLNTFWFGRDTKKNFFKKPPK